MITQASILPLGGPSAGPPGGPAEGPPRDAALRDAAQRLEASFLKEMMGAAGLGRAPGPFGGGAGEEHFSSFLLDAQALAVARAGGVGLAESLVRAMAAMPDALDDLAALLGEERAAILDGDWARLGPLGARKAACLRALEGAPALSLAPLAAGLVRNGALLRAALDGFRDAARRGAMLRAARGGFSTYDAGGARARAPGPRRAWSVRPNNSNATRREPSS